MEVRFKTKALQRLEIDPEYDDGFPAAVVNAYRKRLWSIRGAPDERVFYAMKSLHFEQPKPSEFNEA